MFNDSLRIYEHLQRRIIDRNDFDDGPFDFFNVTYNHS